MSVERIDRLQQLLERVQRNAAAPRPARHAPAPEPVAAAGLEAESEVVDEAPVEFADAAFDDAPAIEVASEQIEDLDLLDDEMVDITDPALEETLVQVIEDSPAREEADEPPASSRRPKAAGSMSEALEDAADQLDLEGREIPLKTPPPESGPQAAPPPPEGLLPPSVPVDLLESADAEDAIDPVGSSGPTAEQLGGTVELEDGDATGIELDEPDVHPSAPPPASSPRATSRPGASASAESLEAELFSRPVPASDAKPAAFASREAFQPESFLELLDASLSLT